MPKPKESYPNNCPHDCYGRGSQVDIIHSLMSRYPVFFLVVVLIESIPARQTCPPTDDHDRSIASENNQRHFYVAPPERVLAGWACPSIVEGQVLRVAFCLQFPPCSDLDRSLFSVEEEAVTFYACGVDRDDEGGDGEREGWEELHRVIWLVIFFWLNLTVLLLRASFHD